MKSRYSRTGTFCFQQLYIPPLVAAAAKRSVVMQHLGKADTRYPPAPPGTRFVSASGTANVLPPDTGTPILGTKSGDKGLSGGAIAGICIAVLLALLLCCSACVLPLVCKGRGRSKEDEGEDVQCQGIALQVRPTSVRTKASYSRGRTLFHQPLQLRCLIRAASMRSVWGQTGAFTVPRYRSLMSMLTFSHAFLTTADGNEKCRNAEKVRLCMAVGYGRAERPRQTTVPCCLSHRHCGHIHQKAFK
jgi:hypothetical protein